MTPRPRKRLLSRASISLLTTHHQDILIHALRIRVRPLKVMTHSTFRHTPRRIIMSPTSQPDPCYRVI